MLALHGLFKPIAAKEKRNSCAVRFYHRMCGHDNLKPVVEDFDWVLDPLVRSQLRAVVALAARRPPVLFDELPAALKLTRAEVIDLILMLHARYCWRRRQRGDDNPRGRAKP